MGYHLILRIHEFSTLIELLNILKDDPKICQYHNQSITQRTIEYLEEIRQDGNLEVHSIVSQITKKYPHKIESKVNTLLEGLLSFHNAIKDKSIIITDTNTHVKVNDILTNAVIFKESRKIIEELKGMTEEEISDLIVDLPFKKLKDVVKKASAELITAFKGRHKLPGNKNGNKYVEEKKEQYDFIITSINLSWNDKKKELLNIVYRIFLSNPRSDYFPDLLSELRKLLEFDNIKRLFSEKYLERIIELLNNSKSYNQSGSFSEILYLLRDSLEESDLEKIINCTLNNRQIYESHNAKKYLRDLFLFRQDIFPFEYNERLKRHNMGIEDFEML